MIEGHIKMMHVVWCAVFGLALTKFTSCTPERVYPLSFVLNLGLFSILFFYVRSQINNKFGLQWADPEDKNKKLFEAQIERYYKSVRFLFFWHLVEVLLGQFLFAKTIGCSSDGTCWHFNSSKGNLFIALHIIGAMLGSGVARAVFIKTPNAHGIFAQIEEDVKLDKKE